MRKSIDEVANPAADRTAQSIAGPFARPNTPRRERRHRDRFSTLRWWPRFDRLGTLIRHATPQPAATIGALAVAMIQPPFGALLMTPIGNPMLLEAGLTPALRAAVTLAAITARANPEKRSAT